MAPRTPVRRSLAIVPAFPAARVAAGAQARMPVAAAAATPRMVAAPPVRAAAVAPARLPLPTSAPVTQAPAPVPTFMGRVPITPVVAARPTVAPAPAIAARRLPVVVAPAAAARTATTTAQPTRQAIQPRPSPFLTGAGKGFQIGQRAPSAPAPTRVPVRETAAQAAKRKRDEEAAAAAAAAQTEADQTAAEAERKRQQQLEAAGAFARPAFRFARGLKVPTPTTRRVGGTRFVAEAGGATRTPGATAADLLRSRRQLMIQGMRSVAGGNAGALPVGYTG